jgi:hypothetical protein
MFWTISLPLRSKQWNTIENSYPSIRDEEELLLPKVLVVVTPLTESTCTLVHKGSRTTKSTGPFLTSIESAR